MVEGFGYLLSFVGIIAAALTITQKEYLMNFIGWLIIMWRDLFVEGDYIEVGKYYGYVKHIRPLYFSIEEASDFAWGNRTGRVIKIPNSLIATNPVVNFTDNDAFVEGKLIYTFTFNSSLEKIQALIPVMEKGIEKLLTSFHKQWNEKQQEEYAHLKTRSLHKPSVVLKVVQEKPSGIQLKIRYLALMQDQKQIESKAFALLMEATADPDITLAVVT